MRLRADVGRYKQCTLLDSEALGGGRPVQKEAASVVVHFSQSNLSVDWDDRFDSLLDLAEHYDMPISAGCRYGDCSTCQTQLLTGEVTYNHATGVQPDAGYCLPCSCRPLTSITLAV